MELIGIIAEHFKNIGIGLAVFSVNLLIQGIVTSRQEKLMEIENQEKLRKTLKILSYVIFIVGGLLVLAGICSILCLNYVGNWLISAFTLFIVAGICTVWSNRLSTKDNKEFGKKKTKLAWILFGISVFLLIIAYPLLTAAVALNWIS